MIRIKKVVDVVALPKNSKSIIAILEQAGFKKVSQKGSHIKMKHADDRVTIAPYPKKDLPLGTVRNIFKSAQRIIE